ncbi:MAG: hypothetical protein MZV64_48670 [Ignavibacteriales bacterium]|nr:hypothetical protein [Ignavibacteriales bacterium]
MRELEARPESAAIVAAIIAIEQEPEAARRGRRRRDAGPDGAAVRPGLPADAGLPVPGSPRRRTFPALMKGEALERSSAGACAAHGERARVALRAALRSPL